MIAVDSKGNLCTSETVDRRRLQVCAVHEALGAAKDAAKRASKDD
jgi:hypothetical protein